MTETAGLLLRSFGFPLLNAHLSRRALTRFSTLDDFSLLILAS